MKNIINVLKKDYLYFIFLFALIIFFSFNRNRYAAGHWKSEIRADKSGYYVYLPATFIYNFDARAFPDNIEEKTGYGFHLDNQNNKVYTKYSCGVAVLHLPFFLVTHCIAHLRGLETSGFSQIYYDSTNVGSVFYLILGLFFLFQFLLCYFDRLRSYLTITLLLLGTNLLYYGTIDGLMTHVYAFFLFSLLLYISKKYFQSKEKRWSYFVLIAITTGLITIVRPINIIFAASILLFLDISGFKELLKRIKLLFKLKNIIIFIIVFGIIVLPQLIYWKYLFGSFVHYSYEGEGFIYKANPKLLEVWFSTNNGLFLYTPFYFVFVAGIILMILKRISNNYLILFSFLFISYIAASWWCWYFGCSYSQRNHVDILPFLAIALGYLIHYIFKIKRIVMRVILFLPILLFVYINLTYTLVYEKCFYSLQEWNWLEYNNYWRKTGLNILEFDSFTYKANFDGSDNDMVKMNANLTDTCHIAYSDKYVSKITKDIVFGPGFNTCIYRVFPKGISKVNISLKAYFFSKKHDLKLVLSIAAPGGDAKVWKSADLLENTINTHEWIDINKSFQIDQNYSHSDDIMVYVMNPSGDKMYIDDLKIRFYE